MFMREHRCSHNHNPEIYVLYGPSIYDDASEDTWGDQWVLRVTRTARQQEVVDGEADQVGDLLHRTDFIIHFCPFCGIHLDHNIALNDPLYVE